MTDEELAGELINRLKDFSPALSIQPGEDGDQVEVSITMSRIPYTAGQMARLEVSHAVHELAEALKQTAPYRFMVWIVDRLAEWLA